MAKYVIEVEKEIEHICDWIKEYFAKNGPNSKAIVGMSGGKDSTIVAALLCRALGHERVYGVIMPDVEMRDQTLAEKICCRLGIDYRVLNIKDAMAAFYDLMEDCHNPQIRTNAPARMRMMVLYGVAAELGGRVVNTCNHSEDYIGFSTKYGDLAGDFSVIQDYPVRWVLEIGDALGLPYEWVHKTPDDGMCGQSDEDKFGFTYETLDAYLIDEVIPDYNTLLAITDMHNRNMHKDAIRLPKPRVKTKHRHGEQYQEQDFWSF